MKPVVFVTRKISDSAIADLKSYCEVSCWEEENTPIPRNLLLEKIESADALLCLLTESIDEELLDRGKKLKIVSNMAVGFNNVNIDYATKKGIAVTNTPGVLTETTADLTFALMMAVARRVVEAEAFLKEGKWKTWSPMLLTGQDIHGATLGIIGLGRIGQALARRAQGFNMKVIYCSNTRRKEVERDLGLEYASMDEVLQQSDYISLLVPYSPVTKDLISYRELSIMKKNAILINSSRGGIVNEQALYDALVNNKIWGAGLDVFEEEPIPLDHPLLTLKNVVATPHVGSASINTRLKMAALAVENILRVLNQEKCDYIVNPDFKENNGENIH